MKVRIDSIKAGHIGNIEVELTVTDPAGLIPQVAKLSRSVPTNEFDTAEEFLLSLRHNLSKLVENPSAPILAALAPLVGTEVEVAGEVTKRAAKEVPMHPAHKPVEGNPGG